MLRGNKRKEKKNSMPVKERYQMGFNSQLERMCCVPCNITNKNEKQKN